MTTRPFSILLAFAGMFMAIFLWQPEPKQPAGGAGEPPARAATAGDKRGRLVVVVIDAWSERARRDRSLHPKLHELGDRPDARWVEVTSCAGNFTLPCLRPCSRGARARSPRGCTTTRAAKVRATAWPASRRPRG